jgi:hypothetical protein
MLYQRSALRHRVVPPSLRLREFPTPHYKRFLTTPQWSPIWIAVCVLVLLVIGVIVVTHP